MAEAPGDDDLMAALFEHRILTTGQLARKTGRSAPVVRRRMRRRLVPDGLVAVHAGGGSTAQQAYSLKRPGFELMAARAGTDPGRAPFSSRPPSGPGSPFFRHTALSNSTWIAIEGACSRPAAPVRLVRAVPEWEMHPDPERRRSRKPWERFIAAERLEDIDDPGSFRVVRPDAVFLIAPRREPELRVAAYLEADRMTCSVSGVVTGKIAGYWHIYLRRTFRRWGAVAMRVLFVVGSSRSERRLGSLRTALADFARRNAARHERFVEARIGAAPPEARAKLRAAAPTMDAFVGCFRMCRREDFSGRDIVTDPVWSDADGRRIPLYRGPSATGAGPAQAGGSGKEGAR